MAYRDSTLKREHRKQCRTSKLIDKRCRNHGDCPWCKRNRTHKNTILNIKINALLKEYNS